MMNHDNLLLEIKTGDRRIEQLANMTIGPKFVQLTAEILRIIYITVKKSKYTPAVRSKILSKLIFASCVWYSDRAYYGLCVLIKDIGQRLPLQLQCSYIYKCFEKMEPKLEILLTPLETQNPPILTASNFVNKKGFQ